MLTMDNKKLSQPKNSLFCFFAASFLPLLFTIYWVYKNTQLPGSDAASFILAADHIYQQFIDGGFWHGLLRAVLDRGWRPIFFPAMTVPFIFLSKGNLLLAAGLTAVTSIFVSTIYVYLYARLMVGRYSSVIITSIICLLALVLDQAVEFFAECFFFPCIVGSIYHLIKSDYFRKFKHAVAFALLASLAALLRPVEMLIHLFPVLVIFICLGLKLKRFTKQKIMLLLGLSLLSLLVIFLSAKYFQKIPVEDSVIRENLTHFINIILSGTIVLFVAWFIYTWTHYVGSLKINLVEPAQTKNDFNLFFAFCLFFIIILAWYLPFAYQTISWIYRTSLGDVAAGTTRMTSTSLLSEINMQVTGEGNFVVYTSLFLCILSLYKHPSLIKRDLSLILPAIFLMLVSILPILEVLFTVQDIIRKLSTAFPLLLMGMLLIGLMKGPWYKARNFFATIILWVQFIGISIAAFGPEWINEKINVLFGFITRPVIMQPNPHAVVLGFLQEQSRKLGIHSFGIEVHPNTVVPIDPFLMNVMISALHTDLSGGYPYLSSYSEQSLSDLHSRFQAIFLSDKADEMKVSDIALKKYTQLYEKEKNPSIKAFYELLSLFSQQKLEMKGWQVGPCIWIKAINHIEYQGCILIAK